MAPFVTQSLASDLSLIPRFGGVSSVSFVYIPALNMKRLLFTTTAALLLCGCGDSTSSPSWELLSSYDKGLDQRDEFHQVTYTRLKIGVPTDKQYAVVVTDAQLKKDFSSFYGCNQYAC